MLGVKEFFKYFWKYFKSKGCAIKKIILWVWILASPIGLAFVWDLEDFDGMPFSFGEKILYFMGFLLVTLMPFVPVFGIILGRRVAKFRKEVDKFSYNDLKNKKEYYRDFLINYSPAVLSYIDDYNLEEKDVIATVLNLELKGKIKIDQDNIRTVSNDESDLELNEKCVLKSIQGKLFNPKFILNEFRNCAYSDVNRHKLLCTQKVKRRGIIKSLIKWTFLFFTVFLGIAWIYQIINDIFYIDSEFLEITLGCIFGIPVIVVGILYPSTALSYCFFAYLQTFTDTTTYRTDKAEKINENMEGLKNFLKDFSLMDEREKKEIELWDRYLIYSVMFGQNKEIVKGFEKYYN